MMVWEGPYGNKEWFIRRSGEGRSRQQEDLAIAKVGGHRDTRRARSEWQQVENRPFNHLPRNSRKNLKN
jgi:hypothetical protein